MKFNGEAARARRENTGRKAYEHVVHDGDADAVQILTVRSPGGLRVFRRTNLRSRRRSVLSHTRGDKGAR
jgi:hypothetical protein